ncbi:alpha-tocopherol transfer protein-like isoform X1 [Diorhabda carinulata]|uniref:alpha-tocopherol transfer protein-like isoform X1 n=1 Tax=Diorhabda carinulata TaxID=1163345 RepID=UPI0025A09325|nr:alpha-tocopherol transfer protein-like isoform X1 [Diorhabda carinulata]XP_057658031.1 alpha-tocopherol transfer protein-like isoform X1 [Diorhabda carinulata]XP_057658032.1 alpha-tocopherol transfer protein-like isoform X1 [Diorhabda carinulata]XP_057658033.1 alpha-tocopherol transfer protein-like isoform X1 [Diorhabda carinulata]
MKSLTDMDNITADTDLEYHFKTEDLVAEGRTSRENMEEIRTFVSNLDDKYVPTRIQDEIILIFLISCANDVALTKKTILSYYYLKKHGPEIYDDRDLNRSDIQLALNTIHMSSIPVRTDDNDVIHYFNIHDTNYRNFELVPIMKVSYMLMDVAHEKNPPNGLIVLIDMKGLSLMHMTRMKMGAIKKYLSFLQEGFPMRLKVIHLINSVYFMDKLLAILKVFMKSELMSMLHIHPPGLKEEELFKLIPKNCLPMEYGGDLPSESELHQKTIEQFRSKQTFWDVEEKLRKLAYKD